MFSANESLGSPFALTRQSYSKEWEVDEDCLNYHRCGKSGFAGSVNRELMAYFLRVKKGMRLKDAALIMGITGSRVNQLLKLLGTHVKMVAPMLPKHSNNIKRAACWP